MKSLIGLISLSVLSLSTIGCTEQPEVEDGIDDSFGANGKADGAIAEGTPEARGVLQAANDATFRELDIDAAMSSRTVTNIINHRVGADGVAGTADDRPFKTLAELDAVPYVGLVALDQLLAYADVRGWIVPLTPFPTCGGAPRLPTTGALLLRTATKSMFARDCDSFGACSEWQKTGADVALGFAEGYRNEVWTDGTAWIGGLTKAGASDWTGSFEYIDIFSSFGTGYPSGGYAKLDAAGAGKGFMNASQRTKLCNAYGCASWSYAYGTYRPVTVKLGQTCYSITDDDPSTNYGHQVKNVIVFGW
jgi:hypothetical protein